MLQLSFRSLSQGVFTCNITSFVGKHHFERIISGIFRKPKLMGRVKFEDDERIMAHIMAHIVNHSDEELSTKIMSSSVLKYFLREEVNLHTTFYSILNEKFKKIFQYAKLVSIDGLTESYVSESIIERR
jgi:hypothetical protein